MTPSAPTLNQSVKNWIATILQKPWQRHFDGACCNNQNTQIWGWAVFLQTVYSSVLILVTKRRSCNMGCIVEFSDSNIRFEFCTRDHKQKTFIDVLLKYNQMDLPHLASILDIPVTTLRDVYYGKTFLATI